MLAVLPAAGPLLLIHRYGVDFHRYDEWDPGIAGLFVKFHNHQATLADLFVQNNEHRIVVPRLLLLLTNPLTHWNNFAVLLMGWACACVTSLVVLALIRKSLATHARILPIWFCCNLLIFSPLQFEIWLWGIGLDQWMLTAILFLSFLIAISRLPLPSKLALCIVLAAASTYCFGNGLLAWPLTGILLLWSVRADLDRPKKSAAVFAWIAACLLCVGFYFHHYIAPPSSAKYSGGIGILDRLLYNLVFMGSPFAHAIHYSATVACAVLGAVMFAMLLSLAAYFARAWTTGRKQLCDRMIVWFIVAAYALLSGLMASFSRRIWSGTGDHFPVYRLCRLLAVGAGGSDPYRRGGLGRGRVVSPPRGGERNALRPGSGSCCPGGTGRSKSFGRLLDNPPDPTAGEGRTAFGG